MTTYIISFLNLKTSDIIQINPPLGTQHEQNKRNQLLWLFKVVTFLVCVILNIY